MFPSPFGGPLAQTLPAEALFALSIPSWLPSVPQNLPEVLWHKILEQMTCRSRHESNCNKPDVSRIWKNVKQCHLSHSRFCFAWENSYFSSQIILLGSGLLIFHLTSIKILRFFSTLISNMANLDNYHAHKEKSRRISVMKGAKHLGAYRL